MDNKIQKAIETKTPVDRAAELLHEIAFAESMVNQFTRQANVKIEAVQNDLSVNCKVYLEMLEVLKTDLNNLAEEHKGILFPEDKKGKEKKKLSLLLKFGEFGFKKSTTLDIPVESYTVQLIEKDQKDFAEQTGINLALTREPKINKKLLQGFTDEVLKQFGIKRDTTEVFYYTSNPESVEAELAELRSK
jgi:hypothetical protein